jgi:hypothetical protein
LVEKRIDNSEVRKLLVISLSGKPASGIISTWNPAVGELNTDYSKAVMANLLLENQEVLFAYLIRYHPLVAA